MARNNDTLWLPENVSITDVASGTEVRWPGTDAAGDFQGRPDDSSRAPSYLDSGWLSRVNRTFGRLFNARGSGALSHNTTVAEVASSVSPHWMEGGAYVSGSQVLHGGTWYIATGEHTATARNAPDQNGAPWESLAKETGIAAAIALAAAGIWQAGTNYPEGAAVLHSGTRYIATQTHTASGTNAPAQSSAPWESVDYRSFNKLYPVGSIYINYSSNKNPADATLLEFGTWVGLPSNYFLGQSGDRYTAGVVTPEGLPNIQGHVKTANEHNHHRSSGVFAASGSRSRSGYGGGYNGMIYSFNASRDAITTYADSSGTSVTNSIFGRNGDQVNPFTLGVYMWRRMA
ncbi:hypothetical protein P0082_07700 [Candidatus Haliotispira prima]|uniref:Chitin-binding type-3 domain-containing protein n=1 Tax=Candidatus Haliotispira prima TaxID=3034016 RepID=A0ABY8MHQ1_9SPIO|nr:hypothetical protein P0082_07700 [Candidatus Haliotispira prima]